MYTITDYGAKAGGENLCTAAIQSAIDDCAKAGGGRVTVPAGVFLTGTIWLRSNVELHLSHGAVLKASADLTDYNSTDAYPQNYDCPEEGWAGKHLILAHEADNVALTGTGTIDGNGSVFFGEPVFREPYIWRDGVAFAKDKENLRPGQLLCFIECEEVRVCDVRIQNTPCWGLFLFGCENVTVRGVRIHSPAWFKNSDGIDIDCCRYVTVSDCIIDTGDDAIAVRGCKKRLLRHPGMPCEYITVSDCILASSAGCFRFGVGTGVIRHVQVHHILMHRGGTGLILHTDYAGSGSVTLEDISLTDISATGLAFPLTVTEGSGTPIRHIRIERFRAEATAGTLLAAGHPDTVSDICLRDFALVLCDGPLPLTPEILKQRGDCMFTAKNIRGLRMENVSIDATEEVRSRWGGEYDLENCPL